MAWSDFLVPGISAVTAIGTGFGAAALKHKWDVEDTKRQWERERTERRREELRAAFNSYLAVRAEIEHILGGRQIDDDARDKAEDATLALFRTRGDLAGLLDESAEAIVWGDATMFTQWVELRLSDKATADNRIPPFALGVNALARYLLGS